MKPSTTQRLMGAVFCEASRGGKKIRIPLMVPELSSPPDVGRYLGPSQAIIEVCRSVAQPGSAPALGAGGPRFESLYSDHFSLVNSPKFLKNAK